MVDALCAELRQRIGYRLQAFERGVIADQQPATALQQRHIVEQKLAAQVKRETRTDVRCLTEAKIASGEAFTGNSHLGACAPRIEVRTPEKLVAKAS